MTFETVQSALRSADPFTELDRIVRAELAAGRRVREVFDALYPMAAPVLGKIGLNPDGREALQGTLDALTGDCDPDQCYQDGDRADARPAATRVAAGSPPASDPQPAPAG